MIIKEALRDQEIGMFKKGNKIGFVQPRGEGSRTIPNYAGCDGSGITVHGSTVYMVNEGVVKGFHEGHVMCEYVDQTGGKVCLGFSPCWIYLLNEQGTQKLPNTFLRVSLLFLRARLLLKVWTII